MQHPSHLATSSRDSVAPQAVKLQGRGGPSIEVEVRDNRSNELLFVEGLGATHRWLATLGYRYVVGTTGIWVRS